jgi:hypothetical protein
MAVIISRTNKFDIDIFIILIEEGNRTMYTIKPWETLFSHTFILIVLSLFSNMLAVGGGAARQSDVEKLARSLGVPENYIAIFAVVRWQHLVDVTASNRGWETVRPTGGQVIVSAMIKYAEVVIACPGARVAFGPARCSRHAGSK